VTCLAHELRYDRDAFDGKKLCSCESVTAWLQLSSRSSSVSSAYCSGVVRESNVEVGTERGGSEREAHGRVNARVRARERQRQRQRGGSA
jgi:hypothetical protein